MVESTIVLQATYECETILASLTYLLQGCMFLLLTSLKTADKTEVEFCEKSLFSPYSTQSFKTICQ